MHPMHALSARDPMQQQQQQQQLLLNAQDQDQQSTMTVLETLNPAQQQQPPPHPMGGEQQAQVMGMIDPVQAQRQQQQHVVQQHLVQQQQQQPHLHQLQPSQQTIEQAMNIDDHHQQLQQQQQRSQHPLEHHHQQQVTRPQIISGEGIVADSGGPIVQWLLDNYEIAEGESLPRSTVYNHYLAHCRQLQMASVNAASFGKLIRSVFVGLKTRRLGTRGHSKYHYFGVRAKQHVQHELLQHHHHHHQQQPADGATGAGCSRTDQQNDSSNHRTEDGSESDSTSLAGGAGGDALAASERLTAASSAKRIKPNHQAVYHHLQQQQQQHKSQQHANEQQLELLAAGDGLYYGSTNNGLAAATNGYIKVQHNNNNNGNNQGNSPAVGDSCELADARNHLGANWSTLVDEHWPQRDTCPPDDEQLIKAGGGEWPAYLVDVFESKYRSYYKRMVELLSELKFAEVEQLWQQFWRPPINEAGASGNPPPTGQQQSSVGSSVVADSSAEVQCWPPMIGGPDSAAASAAAAAPSTQDDMQQGQQQNGAHQMGQFQQQQQQQVELTFSCLYQLTGQPLVVERINQIDYSLYAAIESFLFPDMLSPIPSLLRQQIETFAINVGPCIELATKDYEPRFVAEKSKSARAFGYALRRYAELNRLSTASRAIWERRSSLAQLSMDLSRIDLRYIEHQVSLMTNHKRIDNLNIISYTNDANNSPNNHQRGSLELQAADGKLNSNNLVRGREQVGDNANTKEDVIANENNSPADENSHQHQLENQSQNHNQRHPNQRHHPHNQNHSQYLCAMQPGQLIQNFLHLLEDPYPASSWPDWCRNLFESRVCGLSMEEARNFVLDEWKNYISRIEKELTLRSAPSLSSFHLIKLLFGEYIDYLVDTRLAQARNKTRIHLSGG